MKINKKIAAILSVVLSVCTVSNTFAEIGLNINNKTITSDTAPQIVEGRTLVPVRTIFEELGAKVQWDENNKTVTGKKDEITVSMKIDEKIITVNGKSVEMDSCAMIIDSRTYAPARYVAEAFGYNVDWDSNTKEVIIYTTTTLATTEATTETTTKAAQTTTKKAETTTKKETTTETTTLSTRDILNSSPVEGVSASLYKLVKTDIKNAFKIYYIGNANSNNRFSPSTYNKLMDYWDSTAKDDTEKKFVQYSKVVYASMVSTCKKLDKRIEKHPSSTNVRTYCEKRKEGLDGLINTYFSSVNIAEAKKISDKIKSYAASTSAT